MIQDGDDMSEDPAKSKLETTLLRFGLVGELLLLLIQGDRWWLGPVVLFFSILILVLIVLHSLEYTAPFIYVAF